MEDRDYQGVIRTEIKEQWENPDIRNVCAVMPTGAGKTVTMAMLAAELDEPGLVQAHRQELTGQIAFAFAQVGKHHRIIAPDEVVRDAMNRQIDELGRCYVRPDADYAIASVDTLIRRQDPFFDRVKHWQTDEGHHLLQENKWGRAVGMFGGARGIGWTATPCRADRRSLRRGAGGCYDALVVGPTMRDLINRGFLKDFKVYGLPQRIDMGGVRVGGGGEFNQQELAEAAHRSGITGDIVQHALRLAPGKKGVTFAVDVGLAEEHAQAFRDAGVRAAVLSSYTPQGERTKIIRAYRGSDLDEVVNVDVLGEGFDLPGIVRASFARPTASYGLYVQQFGRALRRLPGEPFGIILDHVGNVMRHKGTPDRGRPWSLDGLPPREAGELPVRICGNVDCLRSFEGFSPECPHCGWRPQRGDPAARERPEILEGDLTLYDEAMLAQLSAEVERIAGPPQIPPGASPMVAKSIEKKWKARAEMQEQLADTIDRWAGYHAARGDEIPAIYRRFWHLFGMNTKEALALSGPKQLEMIERVRASI